MLHCFSESIAGTEFYFGKVKNGDVFIYLVTEGTALFVIAKDIEGEWGIRSRIPDEFEMMVEEMVLAVREVEGVWWN